MQTGDDEASKTLLPIGFIGMVYQVVVSNYLLFSPLFEEMIHFD